MTQQMKNRNILISGAGIAGPTLAYWLHQYGFKSTIVELYPEIRSGGHIIDFWGVGYEVAEKMSMIESLQGISYPFKEIVIRGDRGELKGKVDLKKTFDIADGKLLSFLRSDLSKLLYDKTKEFTDYIFDDSITHMEQTKEGVNVTLKNHGEKKFDLVIGADGLHSNVRSQCFGKESEFEHFLGYYVALLRFDNFLGENFTSTYTMHSMPGKQVAVFSLKEDKISVFMIFKHPKIEDLKERKSQEELIRSEYKDEGWVCSQLIERLNSTSDYYFDSVSQIKMDSWSNQRIALLGDAAFCPSLLAGQGAALAMAGAYTLAGELYQAQGDYKVAFKNYEQFFKPFIQQRQKIALKFVRSFIPSSHFKVWSRNLGTRLLSIPWLSELYWKRFLIDELTLKDYSDPSSH